MLKAGLSVCQSAKHRKPKFVILVLSAKEFLIVPRSNETSVVSESKLLDDQKKIKSLNKHTSKINKFINSV